MRLFSIFFLLGTLFIQFSSKLPSLIWISVLLVFTGLMMAFITNKSSLHNKYKVVLWITVLAFFSGLGLATYSAQKQLDARLPTSLESQDILLQGIIVDIPEQRDDGLRFRFKVKYAFSVETQQPLSIKGIVRLGWYQQMQAVSAGEHWQLRVRLKQPSGFMNPGGFDYEKWLFTERIIATGYVREAKKEPESSHLGFMESRRIKLSPWWSVNHIRQQIHQTIQQQVPDKLSAAVLSALSVADRSKLVEQQWNQLQTTGTSHLVAISGLHIAIVAGFAFLPVFLIWRIFPALNEKIPVRIAGGIVGILFATVYAMLAGFTLPTQRALLMVIIALLGLISRKNYPASSILATALLAVLILDPLAGMTISFWLSFLAVTIILMITKRQLNISKPKLHMVTLQVLLSLGMFPLSLLFFGTASVSAPLANLFAIPWVSLIVVPLTLLGVLFMPISSVLSQALLNSAAVSIDWLFKGLDYLSAQPLLTLNLPEIPVLYLLLVFSGFLFLLLPKGFPGRWLGVVFVFPALFYTPQKPAPNSFSYTLLDAGQGMASVLQTQNHTLIYDVGKRVNDNFDVGKLVVVPYLKAKGLKKVDLMMVSHEDLDHRGGARTVLESVEVDAIQSSDLGILSGYEVRPCLAGTHWRWDGVDFKVLSPPPEWIKESEESASKDSLNYQMKDNIGHKDNLKDNNRSCVLRVSNKNHSLLLTGDIEKRAEKSLMEKYPDNLQSEVVVVPHHGSRTSSSESFIKATKPELALVPAGYRNRFGHPKKDVIERYRDKKIIVMNTVNHGAIELDFPENSNEPVIKSWRKQKKGFWSRLP